MIRWIFWGKKWLKSSSHGLTLFPRYQSQNQTTTTTISILTALIYMAVFSVIMVDENSE
jgi:hypothetical protein